MICRQNKNDEELKQASNKENLAEITEFENEVLDHATSEEEVFFPASIIVGEYLKLKSEKDTHSSDIKK